MIFMRFSTRVLVFVASLTAPPGALALTRGFMGWAGLGYVQRKTRPSPAHLEAYFQCSVLLYMYNR
jgi:hypothetical protein